MNSGNQAVKELAVLNEIVTQLQTIAGLQSNNCYMVAEAVFMGGGWPGDQYVQVTPGIAIDSYAEQGRGYKTAEVRIAIWSRLLTDRPYQDGQKLANATTGLMVLVDTVQNKLTQNFLDGKLVRPLTPKRREPRAGVPAQQTGWARVDRIFAYSHRETFSAQSNDES